MLEIREYIDELGRSRYGRWLASLEEPTKARISIAIGRLERENVSGVKSVGAGLLELRIHFGPGFRVYFGCDGATVVLLLAGGTKASQQQDIAQAHLAWKAYKRRKTKGE